MYCTFVPCLGFMTTSSWTKEPSSIGMKVKGVGADAVVAVAGVVAGGDCPEKSVDAVGTGETRKVMADNVPTDGGSPQLSDNRRNYSTQPNYVRPGAVLQAKGQ